MQYVSNCAPLAILALLSASCSVHQVAEEPRPLVEANEQYAEATPSPPAVDEGIHSLAPWWRSFGDPALDALVRQALDSNLDVRRTAGRIARAAAVLRQTSARLFPAVDAAASYESTWTERSGKESSDAGREEGDEHDEVAAVGLTLAWELDVWGRLRAIRNAAELDVAVSRSDHAATRLLLSASVVETYFEILEQRLQLALIEQQIATNATLLDLTRLRFGQGQSSIVDVLQQREQLASTRALVPAAQSRLQELEYALDVLLGVAPGERPRVETEALPPAPPWPGLGAPSDLLTARPDLRAAKYQVMAIDHLVGAAIADRLPRLVVGGSVSGSGDLRPDTLIASALGDLVTPLFDAGERIARVDERRAELQEAVALWSNAYLNAVREVETAVALERGQLERVDLLEQQLEIARELLRETRNRYSQGLTDYLPVLDAVATQQDLERELITSRRARLSRRVALYRALGGPMPESDPQASELSSVAETHDDRSRTELKIE